MEDVGIGRLGPSASLPGDPDDDRGWSFTGFFDTTESQALLEFQQHSWPETVAWVAESQGRRRILLRLLGPVIRPPCGSCWPCSGGRNDAAGTPIRGR